MNPLSDLITFGDFHSAMSQIKSNKEKLNKQFSGVRDKRCGRAVINEFVRIFQNVEGFIKFK